SRAQGVASAARRVQRHPRPGEGGGDRQGQAEEARARGRGEGRGAQGQRTCRSRRRQAPARDRHARRPAGADSGERAEADRRQRFVQDSQLCPPGSKCQLETARVAEGARFKYAMQLYEEKKDFALAASEFRAFVARYPKSEYAPKALYDALLIADKGDELDVE